MGRGEGRGDKKGVVCRVTKGDGVKRGDIGGR